ncbi:bacteriohemerythrin [Geothrix sp. 21YS21S-2]|uniref:bacteriohemerythrin n=1 Tax=Geothrix sp. 21YS21S-2 TaxID=3068893 RepID=UPI0027B9FEB8|nr:bacteriohemerythrin [Geothrix sp. 21YS21S-2]
MESMVWQKGWEMGDAKLDSQHKAMIRAINHLAVRLEEGRSREGVNRSITFLMVYVELHFREEEEAMERSGYPFKQAHVEQHRECTRRIEALLEKWRNGAPEILRDLVAFFNFWLADHLGDADRRFSEFLRSAA